MSAKNDLDLLSRKKMEVRTVALFCDKTGTDDDDDDDMTKTSQIGTDGDDNYDDDI